MRIIEVEVFESVFPVLKYIGLCADKASDIYGYDSPECEKIANTYSRMEEILKRYLSNTAM